jgi:hypothetical protein
VTVQRDLFRRGEAPGEPLRLASIRLDGGTQLRAELSTDRVTEYADALQDGAEFPPVVVFFDGAAHWLADGFHRWHAHRKANRQEISVDIRTGTARDAILYAAGANEALVRSPEDKRKAVLALLQDAEWGKWSDREIARRCRVAHPLVGKVREALQSSLVAATSEDPAPAPAPAPVRKFRNKHGGVSEMATAAIGGTARAVKPEPESAPAAVRRKLTGKPAAAVMRIDGAPPPAAFRLDDMLAEIHDPSRRARVLAWAVSREVVRTQERNEPSSSLREALKAALRGADPFDDAVSAVAPAQRPRRAAGKGRI